MNWDELIKTACEKADNHILEDENREIYEFSKRHKIRMKRLVSTVGHPFKASPFWRGLVAAMVCLCFLGVATGAYAIGVRIVEWHNTVTDEGTNIRFDIADGQEVPERIEKEYVLNEIPEGFELEYEDIKSNMMGRTYRDGYNRYISFDQYCYIGFSGNFNTENADAEELLINGERGFYIESIHNKVIVWEDGEYVFVIIVPKEFTKDEMLDLACNIVEKE